MGSDHVMLNMADHTQEPFPQHDPTANLSFIVDLDKSNEWMKAIKMKSEGFQFQSAPAKTKIKKEAAAFIADIHRTNEEIFHKRQPLHPKALPWWNAACAIAAQTLWNAQSIEDQGIAQARLKGTV